MAAVLALVRAPLQPGAAPLFGDTAVAAAATPCVSKQSREAAAAAAAAVALTPSTSKHSGAAAAAAAAGGGGGPGGRAHPPAVWALDNILALVTGMGAHSSTFELNGSTFCGMYWVVSVMKTAQVELRNGRVHAPGQRLEGGRAALGR